MASFLVRKDHRYRAHIRLGFFEAVVANAVIAEKLRDAGFNSVEVTGSGRDRLAVGVWPNADTSAEVPEQVQSVEEIP